jgi:endothelin-converting enzyme/putative endopeptidase
MNKLASVLLLAAACSHRQPASAPAPREAASSVDLSALDRSVSPCDDFYTFACGGWQKHTPIPEDRSSWTRSFSEIHQRNEALLHDILERDASGASDAADPFARKVADYYATCMDEAKAETASRATLEEQLEEIDRVRDAKSIARVVARLHSAGARPFFGYSSEQDRKDARQVIGGMDQSGLGMPDRDYYLKDDAKTKELRAIYLDQMAHLLALAGAPEAQAREQAAMVLRFETALAKTSMDKVERRDPVKVYHRLERAGLVKAAPHFDWDAYFAERGTPDVQALDVRVPAFFTGLDALGGQTSLDEVRTYLRWKAIEAGADKLGKAFVDERFRYTRALTGAKVLLPRWKRCVAMTDAALGEALGRTFVTTTLGDDGKKLAKEMILGIEQAFGDGLKSLDWMDDAARAASADKLHKLVNKVGYPDKWRDYTSLQIGRQSLLANARAAAAFESKRDLGKIGKPLDRGEWNMSPPTVNAYYNGSMNEMVFPAGIMQTPFFSPDAASPANYGGLGLVMGHELTHGFDDRGRQFDGDGNLREWWTPEVTKAFKDRAECVAKQYDGYIAVDDVHLNGHLTLGENIADIGGMKLSLAALRARNGGKLPETTGPSGFTPEQEFFVSFAQAWCTNYRPEAARLQAQTNPHSTGQWRVNGPASDNPDFAAAFKCSAGAKMAPVNRCVVW